MDLLIPILSIANAFVYSNIRIYFVAHLRTVLLDCTSIAFYLEDFFESSGLEIYVRYGMTITALVIATLCIARTEIGSTGYPLHSKDITPVEALPILERRSSE